MSDTAWIIEELGTRHVAFTRSLSALAPEQLVVSRHGKWSPAQHLAHILGSVRPVALAMLVPRWFLRWRFGAPNRPARTYPELVRRYQEKLAAGGRAPARFVPAAIAADAVPSLSERLHCTVHRLGMRAGRWSDHDMDTVLLPHPLLGKVTVREMLYFTLYHVQHHQDLVRRDPA